MRLAQYRGRTPRQTLSFYRHCDERVMHGASVVKFARTGSALNRQHCLGGPSAGIPYAYACLMVGVLLTGSDAVAQTSLPASNPAALGSVHPRRRLRFCLRESTGVVRVRRRCDEARGEHAVLLDEMRGETGEQGVAGAAGATGAQGVAGPQGPAGADGALRVYGDGSAGARTVASSTTLDDSNPQYTDFTVAVGVTLAVHSGTIIRCTGTFQNHGTIQVQPALRNQPRISENGLGSDAPNSGGLEASGADGGAGLPSGVAKGLLAMGLLGGGDGHHEVGESGSSGGGNVTILCQGAVNNAGTIAADGESAAVQSRGGGAGGIVILASGTSVTNTGTVQARGGSGGALLATDSNSTGHGPGGGGGGGLIHFIAPSLSNAGTVSIAGGSGGAAGGAGSITGVVYVGGGGGGGCGGAGGPGGDVEPGNSNNGSTSGGVAGASGLALQTLADPSALF